MAESGPSTSGRYCGEDPLHPINNRPKRDCHFDKTWSKEFKGITSLKGEVKDVLAVYYQVIMHCLIFNK